MVVRNPGPVTKDRVKALLAAGLNRAVLAHGIHAVAEAAQCTARCLQKALSHDTLPELDKVLNALDLEPTLLDEVLRAKGFRIVPHDQEMSPDMQTVSQMSRAVSNFIGALEDGKRDHRETLELAQLLRPLVPKLTAIVHEADGLKNVA